MGNGEIQCTKLTQTSNTGSFNTSGSVIFDHSGATAAVDWKIEGRTTAAPSSTTGQLLSVYRPTSSADAISYNGVTTGTANIQTKASVQALIDDGITGWTSFKGTLSGFASNSVVEYRLVDGGKSCQIRIHLNQNGAYFGPTSPTTVGTLPTAARPNYQCLFTALPKSYPMEKLRSVTVGTSGTVQIQPPESGTTQDIFANFMFPTVG
jgi:hypothetical protein